MDGVSVHAYQLYNPEGVVANAYTPLRPLINQYHPSGPVPILSSEWGYSTADGQTGVGLCAHSEIPGRLRGAPFLVNLSQGIPLSIWYNYMNNGYDTTNYEQNFGIVDLNSIPKPAYYEMQLLDQLAKGQDFHRAFVVRRSGLAPDLHKLPTPAGTDPGGLDYEKPYTAWFSTPYVATVSGWGTYLLTSTPST